MKEKGQITSFQYYFNTIEKQKGIIQHLLTKKDCTQKTPS